MYTLNCNYQFSCGLQLQCVRLLPRKGIGFGNLSHCNNCWNFNINWLSLTSLLSDTMKFEMKSVKKYWKWTMNKKINEEMHHTHKEFHTCNIPYAFKLLLDYRKLRATILWLKPLRIQSAIWMLIKEQVSVKQGSP